MRAQVELLLHALGNDIMSTEFTIMFVFISFFMMTQRTIISKYTTSYPCDYGMSVPQSWG